MRTHPVLAALLALALVLVACGDDGGVAIVVNNGRLTAAVVVCPDCKDAVTFRSYGTFVFFGTAPTLSNSLLAQCGFVISQSPPTGSNFVQVRSCSGGVEFAFSSGNFQAFRVRDGWNGQTNNGIRIGSSIDDLLRAQPGFVQVDTLTYVLDNGDVRVEANFGPDRRLAELIVGRGFLR